LKETTYELTKIIVACVTADDLRTITDLATQPGNLVVAVVFDLGDGVRLRELQDQAHAAGAARCHVVDLRAEFALDYLLPVLQKAPEQQTDRFRALARACIARKLADLARLEGADAVYPLPETSAPMPFAVSRGAPSPDSSARIAISF
jgi:argininosuccinate synthase